MRKRSCWAHNKLLLFENKTLSKKSFYVVWRVHKHDPFCLRLAVIISITIIIFAEALRNLKKVKNFQPLERSDVTH